MLHIGASEFPTLRFAEVIIDSQKMKIEESKIKVSRTASVYSSEVEGNAARQWYCCHGYGQLASNMIQKFDRRIAKGELVVCPEGPNRFYWKGVRGNPVATWMTSRYRLEDINDNNQFLSDVYADRISADAQKVILGFSQGGTTLWRWIHERQPDFDVFINYAGWIPEDIELKSLQQYLSDKQLIFVYGEQDEYLTIQRIDALEMVIKRSGLNIEIMKTKGDHSIDRDVIDKIAQKKLI